MSRDSRDAYSAMSEYGTYGAGYTSDQIAVHEYIAKKRGTPLPPDLRHHGDYDRGDPREDRRRRRKEYDEADDEVISFEKVGLLTSQLGNHSEWNYLTSRMCSCLQLFLSSRNIKKPSLRQF